MECPQLFWDLIKNSLHELPLAESRLVVVVDVGLLLRSSLLQSSSLLLLESTTCGQIKGDPVTTCATCLGEKNKKGATAETEKKKLNRFTVFIIDAGEGVAGQADRVIFLVRLEEEEKEEE